MSNIQGPTGSSGTELAWRDEPNKFEIMTWTGYSPATGEYRSTLTIWIVVGKTESILLDRVILHSPYEGWRDNVANPGALVPDKHKRMARAIGRERFGKVRFRALVLG